MIEGVLLLVVEEDVDEERLWFCLRGAGFGGEGDLAFFWFFKSSKLRTVVETLRPERFPPLINKV